MSHEHHHHGNVENLKLAFFLNFGFAIFEVVGGLLINSVAVMTDALHDAGDSLSLGLAWFLQNYSSKENDQRYTYGYLRYSLLGALINAVVLIVGSLIIVREAVLRLLDPESFDAAGMIGFAIIGILVNGFAAYRLSRSESRNVEVVSLHLLEDVLGWAAVLVVGVISLFVDAPILDPLLSIFIALFILYNVFRRLTSTAELFLQSVPGGVDMASIEKALLNLPGVKSLHHMHLWSLDGEHNVFTVHLVVDETASKDEGMRVKRAGRQIIAGLETIHTTIEIDYGDKDCSQIEVETQDETKTPAPSPH
jgi:cobalt-zinc-cadmium efflux system protein